MQFKLISFVSNGRTESTHNIHQMAARALSSSSLCLCVIYLVPLYYLKSMGLSAPSIFFHFYIGSRNNFRRVDFFLHSFIHNVTANQQHYYYYYYCAWCLMLVHVRVVSICFLSHCMEKGKIPKACLQVSHICVGCRPNHTRRETVDTTWNTLQYTLSLSLPHFSSGWCLCLRRHETWT